MKMDATKAMAMNTEKPMLHSIVTELDLVIDAHDTDMYPGALKPVVNQVISVLSGLITVILQERLLRLQEFQKMRSLRGRLVGKGKDRQRADDLTDLHKSILLVGRSVDRIRPKTPEIRALHNFLFNTRKCMLLTEERPWGAKRIITHLTMMDEVIKEFVAEQPLTG